VYISTPITEAEKEKKNDLNYDYDSNKAMSGAPVLRKVAIASLKQLLEAIGQQFSPLFVAILSIVIHIRMHRVGRKSLYPKENGISPLQIAQIN